jgi:hypothetical protein
MGVPMGAAATVVEFPPRPAPDAPGPFAFADPERVKKILGVAGFTDVAIEGREPLMAIVGSATLDQAVDFLVQIGPTGSVLREADAATRARVTAVVKEAIAPFHRPEGLRMQGAIWLVSARAA